MSAELSVYQRRVSIGNICSPREENRGLLVSLGKNSYAFGDSQKKELWIRGGPSWCAQGKRRRFSE